MLLCAEAEVPTVICSPSEPQESVEERTDEQAADVPLERGRRTVTREGLRGLLARAARLELERVEIEEEEVRRPYAQARVRSPTAKNELNDEVGSPLEEELALLVVSESVYLVWIGGSISRFLCDLFSFAKLSGRRGRRW